MQHVRRQRTEQQPEHRRSGSVTLEFIIAFPIIFIASLAIAQFFFLSLIIEAGSTALHEGTRHGADVYPLTFPIDQAGADNDIVDRIIEVMNEHLRVHNIEIVDTVNGITPVAPSPRNRAAIRVDYEGTVVTRPSNSAESPVSFPLAYVPPGGDAAPGEIVVSLRFELTNSVNADGIAGPVPDWLSNFGFTLQGTNFEMTSRHGLE